MLTIDTLVDVRDVFSHTRQLPQEITAQNKIKKKKRKEKKHLGRTLRVTHADHIILYHIIQYFICVTLMSSLTQNLFPLLCVCLFGLKYMYKSNALCERVAEIGSPTTHMLV